MLYTNTDTGTGRRIVFLAWSTSKAVFQMHMNAVDQILKECHINRLQ